MRFAENDLTVAEVVLACSVRAGMGDRNHPNRPNHGIALIVSGKNRYEFSDGRVIEVEPGGIIYLPKGSTYIVDNRYEGTCYAINFQLVGDPAMDPVFLRLRHPQSAIDCFRRAERAWKQKNPGYRTAVMAELYSILSLLRAEYEAEYMPSRKSEQIRRAVEYIHAEYTDSDLSLPAIAEAAGVSEVYFRRIFLAEYGTTPIRYINRLRFERAKELLRSGYYQIREVSVLSGFSDEVYFSRAFRAETGKSPSEYRNEAAE